MKVKKTEKLDFNYRREVLPPMTEDQYLSLQAGDTVELDSETAEGLLEQSLVTKEN